MLFATNGSIVGFFSGGLLQVILKDKIRSLKDIQEMFLLLEGSSSLDAPSFSIFDQPLLDTIPDEAAKDPAASLEQENLKKRMTFWLSQLPQKYREVLIRRYGLLGHEVETLEEVGLEVGLTRERGRQIQTEALRRLKRQLASDRN